MTFRLGLTGSIGMGKSTTAAMFAAANVPLWDADACVHRLYDKGGEAVAPLSKLCPQATKSGVVDRTALKEWIGADATALRQIEAVVHPMVAADRAAFLLTTKADLVVLDIPLLFENDSASEFDATLLVTAPAEIQRSRVLNRPGMTVEQFNRILARQMPDGQKRGLATHIVETLDLVSTQAYVSALITHIRGRDARNRS